MSQFSMTKKRRGSQSQIINLLRLCTVLLAAVSFWATAQGMESYVFENGWQAYAASLSIQGILLGLNFYLPAFLRNASGKARRNGLLLLTGVVLFCSSWFSYIFIVDHVYSRSWEVDSRLLIQSSYRRELYRADDYAEKYTDTLLNSLTAQILEIYGKVTNMSLNTSNVMQSSTVDWRKERESYTGVDFSAAIEMAQLITDMEIATTDGAGIAERRVATESLKDLTKLFEDKIEQTKTQLVNEGGLLVDDRTRYDRAKDNYENPSAGSNLAVLEQTLQEAEAAYNNRQQKMKRMEQERDDYQLALDRAKYYEIMLNRANQNSANALTISLQNIQKELFVNEPDLGLLESETLAIFEQLQNDINAPQNENTQYRTLITQTGNFLEDLRNYRSVSVARTNFSQYMEDLRSETQRLLNDAQWKSVWSNRLDQLKSQISALPVPVGEGYDTLNAYDRANASDTLDNVIRLYIAEHNAAQQGLIYLYSPYRGLAVFSLILAFFLDIAAFITGVLIDSMEVSRMKRKEADLSEELNSTSSDRHEWETSMFTLSQRNRYIYLNGDYIRLGEKNSYRAIENGQEISVIMPQTDFTAPGFYFRQEYAEENRQWKPIPSRQELRLGMDSHDATSQDGIYQSSKLRYYDHALSIQESSVSSQYRYLVSVPENIPLFQLGGSYLNHDPVPISQLDESLCSTAIIALNEHSTMVAAVYLYSDSNKDAL